MVIMLATPSLLPSFLFIFLVLTLMLRAHRFSRLLMLPCLRLNDSSTLHLPSSHNSFLLSLPLSLFLTRSTIIARRFQPKKKALYLFCEAWTHFPRYILRATREASHPPPARHGQ